MDFDFSDDQASLRDAVRKWVDKGYTFERRRGTVKAGGFCARPMARLPNWACVACTCPRRTRVWAWAPLKAWW